MSSVFFILIIVSLLHFIYEGIVAPSIRLVLRYKLFKLRDRLRWFKITEPQEMTEEFYSCAQSMINNSMRLLPVINFSNVISSSKVISKDKELSRRVEKRIKIISDNSTEKTQGIVRKVLFIFTFALLTNCGFLVIFLFPFILGSMCIKSLVLQNKRIIKSIVSVPESEIEKIDSPCSLAFA